MVLVLLFESLGSLKKNIKVAIVAKTSQQLVQKLNSALIMDVFVETI